MKPTSPTKANKTDAGNGSKAICRVSNVLRSPSPDPRRSPQEFFTVSDPRENLLKAIWDDANSMLSDAWIRSTISSSERRPDDPFADTGRILQRLLELGASPYDLALLCRNSSLSGAFTVLFEAQMQFSDCDEFSGLHTELLNADPSGGEARPGSAPAMSTQTEEGEQDGTSNGG